MKFALTLELRKKENYRVQACLSCMQHKNLTPIGVVFLVNSSQMTLSTLI